MSRLKREHTYELENKIGDIIIIIRREELKKYLLKIP